MAAGVHTSTLFRQFGTPAALVSTNSYVAPATNASNRADGPWSFGFRFTVSDTITVTMLGRFWATGNTGNRPVKIWNMDTNVAVASATVLAASASDAGGYKFQACAAVLLVPGVNYAIVEDVPAGQQVPDQHTHDAPGVITLGASCYVAATGTQPTNSGASGYTYGAPAFQYIAPLPAPSGKVEVYDLTTGTSYSPARYVPYYEGI